MSALQVVEQKLPRSGGSFFLIFRKANRLNQQVIMGSAWGGGCAGRGGGGRERRSDLYLVSAEGGGALSTSRARGALYFRNFIKKAGASVEINARAIRRRA